MSAEDYLSLIDNRCRYGEIRYMRTENLEVSLRNGVVVGPTKIIYGGWAVRTLNKTFGFATSDSDVKEACETSLHLSNKQGKEVKLSEEEANRDEWKVEEKKKLADVGVEEIVDLMKHLDSMLEDMDVKVRMLNFKLKIVEKEYANTEGSYIKGRIPSVEYFHYIGIMENGKSEMSYIQLGRTGGYEQVDLLNLEDVLKDEVNALRKVIKAPKAPSGKMDLIVGPEVAGIIAHESCGHPMEADRIMGREAAQAGESFVKADMIGTRIGSEVVNVVDDPTIPNSFGHYLYDDEGVKARRRYLYKEGIINEFLHNRESAGKMGVRSTAAARSSLWNREPIPRMSTTFFEPGDYSFEELIEDVKYGIYMKTYTEWNIDDVRFNQKYTGRESYIIENGEIKDAVRWPVLEITTKELYSKIDAVGKDLQFYAGTCGKGDPMQGVDVWMGGPHLRIREVYIG